MLKRTMTAVLTITLMVTAGAAMGQCVIGVYADAAGTQSIIEPILGKNFNIYVVLRNESSVEGASYSLSTPAFTGSIAAGSGAYGPNGAGLSIVSPGGENIGFSICAIGFGGNAVLVAQYETFVFSTEAIGGLYEVHPNIDEDSQYPVHATCNGFIVQCENSQALEITDVIATESTSFGAVKSLY